VASFSWYWQAGWARYRGRHLADSVLADIYRRWPQSLRQPIADLGLISVDLETTGLDPAVDQIISIGWVGLDHRRIYLESARELWLKISGSVGQSARFHQITDRHLAEAISLQEALEQLLGAAVGRIWLFHHAGLDQAFLDRACQRFYGSPLRVPFIDTLALERQRHGHGPRPALRLHQCRQRYGLPEYRGHQASIDALATAELWLAWRCRQARALTLADCLI